MERRRMQNLSQVRGHGGAEGVEGMCHPRNTLIHPADHPNPSLAN